MLLAALMLAQAVQPPNGIWQSEGYGHLWEIAGETFTGYEVTTGTCLKGGRAARRQGGRQGELVYRAETTLGAVAADWVIRAGWSARRLVAHSPGTAAEVVFRRLSRLPDRCRRPADSSRAGVFDLFSLTMAEQYAFFREHQVDWSVTVAAARPLALAAATDTAFYHILAAMVAPLHDRHTDVTATTLGLRVRNGRPLPDSLATAEVVRLRSAAPALPLIGGLFRLHGDRLQYGKLSPGVGYLKVTAVYGYQSTGGFEGDSTAFQAALDQVFAGLGPLVGLVLDLRINGGGYDALAKLLAGRFTDRRYLGFTKQARIDPNDATQYTAPSRVFVEPAGRRRFTGRLAVLLGPNTLSAGEVLAMMLAGRRPRPRFIGAPTQGIFADELVRRLPNGWQFQLSNERYAMPSGEVYEGRGVPVDQDVAVFGRPDRALEAAVRWVSLRRGGGGGGGGGGSRAARAAGQE
jgi:hypothetical protein